MKSIEYRVENKYLVSEADLAVLAHRLHGVMTPDIHQDGSSYEIRSVYFDDAWDHGLDENDAGVDCRRKYRIRTYGAQDTPVRLEIKEKQRGFTKKTACSLTDEEAQRIMEGGMCMRFDHRKPLNRLYLQMRCMHMRPKVLIIYDRTAFVHPSGNVRITFDRNIMASRNWHALFDTRISGLIPVLPVGMHVLEVKYDEFLPDMIARQLELGKLNQTAFSKYALGRMAVNGEFPMMVQQY